MCIRDRHKTHTPRKGSTRPVVVESGAGQELAQVQRVLGEREKELEQAYRKLVVLSKAYSTSGDAVEAAHEQNAQLKQLVEVLELELENSTGQLHRDLEQLQAQNGQLLAGSQASVSALELAHSGRDTAEDAKRQLHVALRHQVDVNKELNNQLSELRKQNEQLASDLKACQQAVLMRQQELEHTRHERDEAHARAHHFEAEMRSHRNVLRKTTEFTAMLHSLSGEELAGGCVEGRLSPPGPQGPSYPEYPPAPPMVSRGGYRAYE
eukprot:TRINITY_DN6706_c0_g1_i1.p1 TRINITY_DN6706_c0_g1~~TRINITY_DN6706_c0_g1_i1.p1  ORF type:complete len:266 (-),score=94.78 TRINITY_DN6706_c0_g1_i1:179-976(-)